MVLYNEAPKHLPFLYNLNYLEVGVAAIPDLFTRMNNNLLGLKFIAENNNKCITFLDLCLEGSVESGIIETATYRKEVAENTILSAKSCHPFHTRKSIPIGEMKKCQGDSF